MVLKTGEFREVKEIKEVNEVFFCRLLWLPKLRRSEKLLNSLRFF